MPKAISMNCPSCDAVMDVQPGLTKAWCGFCGHTSLIKHTQAPQPTAQPAPGSQGPVASPAPTGPAPSKMILLASVLLLAAGGAVAFLSLGGSDESTWQAEQTTKAPPTSAELELARQRAELQAAGADVEAAGAEVDAKLALLAAETARMEAQASAQEDGSAPASLSRTAVAKTFRSAKLSHCPGTGVYRAKVVIAPDGRVASIAMSPEGEATSGCIAKVLERLRFPVSTEGATVTYPIRLKKH